MRIVLSPKSAEDYRKFLRVKSLPKYSIHGHVAEVPDEYAGLLNMDSVPEGLPEYVPSDFLFDYQGGITATAVGKGKFSVFADCGLGKTLIFLEFLRYVDSITAARRCSLIVSPLMVVEQTIAEAERFYGGSLPIRRLRSSELGQWLLSGKERIGIVNYEAMNNDVAPGRLAALVLDESSMLKSQYGKWGGRCLSLGRGLRWKMCCTGTPAPNDRIEYANHAVFMDAFPTVNSFYSRFFVNRGDKNNKWELKPHGLRDFYLCLSHWSIFLTNPATYGWRDHSDDIPPIRVHTHDVPMTAEQERMAAELHGGLFMTGVEGGIASRSRYSQIAKGHYKGRSIATNKPAYIRRLVDSWPDESTIIWCWYNAEQELIERTFPEAVSITGATPYYDRKRMIDDFKSGRKRIMITKPRILGFGLNLQRATRQVFSGLQDSYESYYQAVKRSNRVGSLKPLDVHIPITEIERPMVDNVLRKADRVQVDTERQERIFRDASTGW